MRYYGGFYFFIDFLFLGPFMSSLFGRVFVLYFLWLFCLLVLVVCVVYYCLIVFIFSLVFGLSGKLAFFCCVI